MRYLVLALLDGLLTLALAGRRGRIEYLIEKQKLTGLNDDEKAELRQLGERSASAN